MRQKHEADHSPPSSAEVKSKENKYVGIDNLRSQPYSSVLYYTRISRHVSANSKPSSGVVALKILKVSNHIKNSNGSVASVLKFGNCCSQRS
jgi:hypothetical protein